MDTLENLRTELVKAVDAAQDPAALEAVRVSALGKKGRITHLMKSLTDMGPEERRQFGQSINTIKGEIADLLEARKAVLANEALDARLAQERVDITLPGRPEPEGFIHPIGQTYDEIIEVFGHMGFSIADGPDVEDDFHNFTALNFPSDHPARDMHDTFFLESATESSPYLLRTHTSPVEIRTMMTTPPPLRVIAPGRTYRRDSDMTHTPMFHQIEGLVIEKNCHMGHLKGCIQEFLELYFETSNLPVRFRPSFFPFTEPSAEVDVGCSRKDGKLKLGAGNDWLEILGCGMVHPHVLRACHLDPEEYQGFAFGVGLERIAMLKYGIPDLRAFFDSDIRWLRHYGFKPYNVPTLCGGLS